MASIFSTQNLQTFLRRKYLRPPPSRPPPGRGPRGPPGRGPRSPEGEPLDCPPSAGAERTFSSAMIPLKISCKLEVESWCRSNSRELATYNFQLQLDRCRSRFAAGGFGRRSHGFSSSSNRSRSRGASPNFRVAQLLDLLQALLFLVNAHSD